ncbi:Ff.00g062880.m01.CDS01 [Fusarium sp. VM40]|nr:Ff.00g062880.m01.CDS01 [Fusarium sp. VM40]
MDIFSRLPSLVLNNVLGQIQDDRDLLNLISASPESLRIYNLYRYSIMRQRLVNILDLDIDGTMLQDAQLIMCFPSIDGPEVSFGAISECLDSWDAQSFPNPVTQQSNQESVTGLYHFFKRLVVFIEDYLSKSLDPFTARACMTLPTIGRIVPTAQFKGQETDIQPVVFGSMEKSIKRHLLKAFLRFELRCKVYHPRVWSHLEGTTYADMINKSNEKLGLNDYEELYCVFEYLKGLYGAIFAHCRQDSWFPERSVSKTNVPGRRANNDEGVLLSAKNYGLLFSDDQYFDMEKEVFLGLLELEGLPCLGLDSLSAILRSPELINTKGCRMTHWVGGLAQQPDSSWILSQHFTLHHDLYVSRTRIDQWKWWMESRNQSSRHGISVGPRIDIHQQKQQLHLQNLQSAIYRQRAWIFFTNSSTHQPCLPSWDHLATQRELVSDVVGLGHHQLRRRSQKWQDYWAGRSLDDPLEADSSHVQDEEDSGELKDVQFIPPAIPRFFEIHGGMIWQG